MAIDETIKSIYSGAKQRVFGKDNTSEEYSLNKTKRSEAGFTLSELLVVSTSIGILAAIAIPSVMSYLEPAHVAQCCANMEKAATDINTATDGGRFLMTQEQYASVVWKGGDNRGIWYVPNNKDANRGHGNDLDGCDEENPGESSKNRECIPMRWVLVCNHDHKDAKYIFRTDGRPPTAVAYEGAEKTFLKDFKWYEGKKDPGFDKWYGRMVTAAD